MRRAKSCQQRVFFILLLCLLFGRAVPRAASLPDGPARYALEREAALKVFLAYPNVPLDTNHLEREIRAIALGRRKVVLLDGSRRSPSANALESKSSI